MGREASAFSPGLGGTISFPCRILGIRTVGDGLPLEACRRSAVEAADFIRKHPHALPHPIKPNQQTRYQENRRVSANKTIDRCVAFVALSSVLVAKQDDRGREGCEALSYSSEDGSHRAIAMALAGHETIAAWIGHPGTPRRNLSYGNRLLRAEGAKQSFAVGVPKLFLGTRKTVVLNLFVPLFLRVFLCASL